MVLFKPQSCVHMNWSLKSTDKNSETIKKLKIRFMLSSQGEKGTLFDKWGMILIVYES